MASDPHVPPLPPPPRIALTVSRDRTASASATGGFVNLRRLDLVARFPSGATSEPFAYDLVDREALDAVVIVAHFVREGRRQVFLRSCVRPPAALRDPGTHDTGLWELPAGLIDPGETPAAAAARELEEEVGVRVDSDKLHPLGPFTYPAPALIGERHTFFHVEVDPSACGTPSEDGSVLEREAAIVALPVDEALTHCRDGAIRDAKTELGLRRFREMVPA